MLEKRTGGLYMTKITIKEMLDSGTHFGHQASRWNPKMEPYIYGKKNSAHIIDLQQSVQYAQKALMLVEKLASEGKKIIFVGTKPQSAPIVKEAALSCDQPFVIKRWLGGTLTNFSTIKNSIDWLKKVDMMRESGQLNQFVKKERVSIEKKYAKIQELFEGIRYLTKPPDAVFVLDTIKDKTAILEANKLKIPVIALVDTNVDPSQIDYLIPANDDSIKSIRLFSQKIAEAYLAGYALFKEKGMLKDKEAASRASSRLTEASAATSPKMVPAGLAEEVEIAAEIEQEAEVEEKNKALK